MNDYQAQWLILGSAVALILLAAVFLWINLLSNRMSPMRNVTLASLWLCLAAAILLIGSVVFRAYT